MTKAIVLTGLRKYADDKEFQKKWRAIKHANKERLAAKIKVWRPSLTSVREVDAKIAVPSKRCHA